MGADQIYDTYYHVMTEYGKGKHGSNYREYRGGYESLAKEFYDPYKYFNYNNGKPICDICGAHVPDIEKEISHHITYVHDLIEREDKSSRYSDLADNDDYIDDSDVPSSGLYESKAIELIIDPTDGQGLVMERQASRVLQEERSYLNQQYALGEITGDEYMKLNGKAYDRYEDTVRKYSKAREHIANGKDQTCCICNNKFTLVNDNTEGIFGGGLGDYDTNGNEILRNDSLQCLAHKKCLEQSGQIHDKIGESYAREESLDYHTKNLDRRKSYFVDPKTGERVDVTGMDFMEMVRRDLTRVRIDESYANEDSSDHINTNFEIEKVYTHDYTSGRDDSYNVYTCRNCREEMDREDAIDHSHKSSESYASEKIKISKIEYGKMLGSVYDKYNKIMNSSHTLNLQSNDSTYNEYLKIDDVAWAEYNKNIEEIRNKYEVEEITYGTESYAIEKTEHCPKCGTDTESGKMYFTDAYFDGTSGAKYDCQTCGWKGNKLKYSVGGECWCGSPSRRCEHCETRSHEFEWEDNDNKCPECRKYSDPWYGESTTPKSKKSMKSGTLCPKCNGAVLELERNNMVGCPNCGSGWRDSDESLAKELYGQNDPDEILGGGWGTPENTRDDLLNSQLFLTGLTCKTCKKHFEYPEEATSYYTHLDDTGHEV